jgi:methylmalonyl-CoA/ethylmalonyl-CoA epimerase
LKLEHIGIAVANLDESEHLLRRLLGRGSYKRETVARQSVTTSFFTGGSGEAKLELVAPVDRGGPVQKYLDRRGPGIHHLAFEVEDIAAEMRRLREDGFELLSELPQEGADHKLICFLHPRSTGGILVEICQSR